MYSLKRLIFCDLLTPLMISSRLIALILAVVGDFGSPESMTVASVPLFSVLDLLSGLGVDGDPEELAALLSDGPAANATTVPALSAPSDSSPWLTGKPSSSSSEGLPSARPSRRRRKSLGWIALNRSAFAIGSSMPPAFTGFVK
eukprot:5243134-Pyramimonas_sp.AAC.1